MLIGNLFHRQPHGTEDLGEVNRFDQDSVEEGTQTGFSQLDDPPDHHGRGGGSSE